jgi:hypothetical protein
MLLPRRRAALAAAGVLLLSAAAAAAAASEGRAAPVVRTVDDVAPALRNATSSAIVGAQAVLESYSDFLIAVAIRT